MSTRELLSSLNPLAGDDSRAAATASVSALSGNRPVLLVQSGRAGLRLALSRVKRASGRVAVPAYTCPVVIEAAMAAGFDVDLVDVNYETLEMDEAALDRMVPRPDAVVPVHLFGDPVQVGRLRSKPWTVIEDCAQALGAKNAGRNVGTEGDYAVFSFGIGKVVGPGIGGAVGMPPGEVEERPPIASGGVALGLRAAFWSAGMKFGATTLYSLAKPFLDSRNKGEDERQLDRIRSHACKREPPRSLPSGVCDALQSHLGKVDQVVQTRRKNAAALCEMLRDAGVSYGLSAQALDQSSIFTRFVIRLRPERLEDAKVALFKSGIECETPYSRVLSRLIAVGPFEGSRRLLSESLSIPVHHLVSNRLGQISEIVARAA